MQSHMILEKLFQQTLFVLKGKFNYSIYSGIGAVITLVSLIIIVFWILIQNSLLGSQYGTEELRRPSRITNAVSNLDFTSVWSVPSGSTHSIKWGDIDGDSDLDLVLGNNGNDVNQIYRNDGDYQFTLIWESLDFSNTRSIALGDMDGDGDLDIASGNYGQPNQIYQNLGDGNFVADWSSSDSLDTTSVAWGDVDLDGDLDLAIGNEGQVNQLYVNQGDGDFVATTLSSHTLDTRALAWGDADRDGDLDLVIANNSQVNQVFCNSGGTLNLSWQSTGNTGRTTSVAWGDMENDGDLDLLFGDTLSSDHIYRQTTPCTFSLLPNFDGQNDTQSVAWADINNDSLLDVVIGSLLDENQIYLNSSSGFSGSSSWESETTSLPIRDIAIGDMDNDGDLDLAFADSTGGLIIVFRNDSLWEMPQYTFGSATNNSMVAWGDIDGDNDLDLAVANAGTVNQVYENDGVGNFALVWESPSSSPLNTESIAWGDFNGDNYLDLAVGNYGQANEVYQNNGTGGLVLVWQSSITNTRNTTSVSWGDMDLDGDLDLVVGNDGQSNEIYKNDSNGGLELFWQSPDTLNTDSIAWGDMDNDGDLDLAIGNKFQPDQVFRNNYGDFDLIWESPDAKITKDVAWGDMNGDNLLDLIFGYWGAANQIYINKANTFSVGWAEPISGHRNTVSVAIGDLDNDGDNDIAFGNDISRSFIYQNLGDGSYSLIWDMEVQIQTSSLAWGDADGDGDLDLAISNRNELNEIVENVIQGQQSLPNNPPSLVITPPQNIPEAGFYSSSSIIEQTVFPITVTLYDEELDPIPELIVEVSQNGGGIWKEAHVTSATDLVNLSTAPYPNQYLTNTHVLYLDIFASGFFGQSDNVLLRITALAHTTNGINNTMAYYGNLPISLRNNPMTDSTYPFRLRGTQVQVYSEMVSAGNEQAGAQVMRLPAGQTTGALFMSDSFGNPYETNGEGYLQGFGELGLGDQIVAMLPITATESYTLYHTSYEPMSVTLGMHEVMTPGVQILTVSADNPLVIFNPTISLEWDARGDEEFLTALDNAFRRASETLFDVTNGQVALGDIRVYHNRENWVNADIVVHASGSVRPKASMGGVAITVTDDIDNGGQPIVAAYGPGQVRMGTVWDPFGENTSELAEDWWLALAHELAHYYLYLPDNYLGLDMNGAFRTIDCAGSFMTSTYDDTYSELLNATEWANDPVCANDTFAANTTGRHDWATVTTFYPMLFEPASRLDGPVILPLDLVNLSIFSPTTGITTSLPLPSRNIDLRDSGDNLLSLPSAQGYLFQRNGAGDEDDTLLPLGQANGDRLKVRGAQPGDTLCIFAPFDAASGGAYLGCDTDFQATDSAVNLSHTPDWQPNIRVTAVTSMTLDVTVTLTSPLTDLSLQLFPAYSSYLDPTAPLVSPVATLTPTDASNLVHVATVSTPYPLFEGHIHVTDSTDAYQAILPFYLNPPWGPVNRPIDMGPNTRAWGANVRAFNAPIASGDGAVTIYNRADAFGETGTFSLQGLASPPNLPSWMTPVGQGYRFVATVDNTAAISRTIAFDYLQRDVPSGYEYTLAIAYSPDEGATWERLVTNLDTNDNLISAPMPTANDSQGIYVIVSSLALPPLESGWNTMVYPFPVTRPVGEVFESIASVLNRTCDSSGEACYEAGVLADHPEFAVALNDLTTIPPFTALQVNVTEAITPFVGIEGTPAPLTTFTTPPATYFGWMTATAGFTPTVGMSVTAYIDDNPCGQTTVTNAIGTSGQLAYVLDVRADSGDGCGNVGETVSFQVGTWLLDHDTTWANDVAQYHPLDTVLIITPPLFNQGDVLFSPGGSGTIGDVRFRSEDIIGYDVQLGIAYHVIDGSDIDLRDTNINAFTLIGDNDFLISVSQPITLPDVGPIQPSDIVLFEPIQLGRTTDGDFTLFFTGSAFGLTENIDALHLSDDGQTLFISTATNAAGLGRDEDILAFDLNTNSWTRHFDGFDVGLSATSEDTNGIWYDAQINIWYLTTEGAFTLPNLNGLGSDIFACLPVQLGEDTQCNFLPNLWVGTEAGLGGVSVDAFAIHR